MATSVSNTAYGIINDAYHDAGLLQLGDNPNSQQLACKRRSLFLSSSAKRSTASGR